MDKKTKQLAQEWLKAAKSDYQYARVGIEEKKVFPQIAFLAQQSVEKFLKAFLVFHRVEPPRIHELPKLLDECVRIEPKLKKLRDACELLTGFYIEARYPPDIPEYSRTEILEAFKSAQKVKEKIEKLVGK